MPRRSVQFQIYYYIPKSHIYVIQPNILSRCLLRRRRTFSDPREYWKPSKYNILCIYCYNIFNLLKFFPKIAYDRRYPGIGLYRKWPKSKIYYRYLTRPVRFQSRHLPRNSQTGDLPTSDLAKNRSIQSITHFIVVVCLVNIWRTTVIIYFHYCNSSVAMNGIFNTSTFDKIQNGPSKMVFHAPSTNTIRIVEKLKHTHNKITQYNWMYYYPAYCTFISLKMKYC